MADGKAWDLGMKRRSECHCPCHADQSVFHVAPCCVPDPPEDLEKILDVPYKIWFCKRCPRDKCRVHWHGDNAVCITCGFTRVQELQEMLIEAKPDVPEFDGLEHAHPAWWRGYDAGLKAAKEKTE